MVPKKSKESNAFNITYDPYVLTVHIPLTLFLNALSSSQISKEFKEDIIGYNFMPINDARPDFTKLVKQIILLLIQRETIALLFAIVRNSVEDAI